MTSQDLQLLKKHVRADDFSEDDDYLATLWDAAAENIVSRTNRTAEELMNGMPEFPSAIRLAIMQTAAHWYNQRESVSGVQMHQVPDSVETLIKPYRKLAE